MLKPMSKEQENRIVRNVIQACKEDIEKLNKYGYGYLYLCSNFTAHYNLGGFIDHYGSCYALRDKILNCEKMNSTTNYREGEKDYPYYKQKADIYKRICSILRGKRRIPAESTCFKAPSLKIIDEYIKKGYTTDKTIQTCIDRYMNIFSCGTFFCGDYKTRAIDLAYITELYNCIQADETVNDDNFYRKEFVFPSGNTGTFYELMRVYGDHLYDIYAELTGQLEEEEVYV